MRPTAAKDERLLRRLARDHWVRLHGTPRVTVLVGGPYARQLWTSWLALTSTTGELLEGDEVDRNVRNAVAASTKKPRTPIAVLASKQALAEWRTGRTDRLSALVDEGMLEVPEPRTGTRDSTGSSLPLSNIDARSAAELALFEALEATPAASGRFKLNESLSVRFGSRAAEIDLLSRADSIAIEIDGFHHFADPDCYRRDRRKDLLLQTQGLLVIRLLAEDVLRDPRDAVSIVCQGLAFRLGKG